MFSQYSMRDSFSRTQTPPAKRCKTNAHESTKDKIGEITEQDVTIHLEKELVLPGEADYHAFNKIHVDIFLRGKKAGKISGTRIDRDRIPEHCFYAGMDSYSSSFGSIADKLFEPRLGRPKLCSLQLEGDDPKFDILYINSLKIDEEYQVDNSSDLGTFALRKLLYHPYIVGPPNGYVSCCLYVMDDTSPESRSHANHFLRNGFIQDKYLAEEEDGDRYLIAARGHWSKPLKSHEEALATELDVFSKPPSPPLPTGKDAEILQVVKEVFGALEPPEPSVYRSEISRLIDQGGSLARSKALFTACYHRNKELVEFILEKDPSQLDSRDEENCTPLMVAADAAARATTMEDIPKDQPILRLLIAAGAKKEHVNSEGMTAYGILTRTHKRIVTFGRCPKSLTGTKPGLSELQSLLMPPNGPTTADRNGGLLKDGFIDIQAIDRELGCLESDDEDNESGEKNKDTITEQDVTIHLEHILDSEAEYNAFTSITVDILLRGEKVGKISGTRVDRANIPDHCFYYAMDSHSSDLQYVAETLFENRCGRTKLSSLQHEGDDPEFDVLYIESIEVNKKCQVDWNSDIGTFALRKLLYHPYIKSPPSSFYDPCADPDEFWGVTTCVYVMNDMKRASRKHAIQFLRNGFIQDQYLAWEGENQILVAAYGHWERPVKSHADAAATRFHFIETPVPLSGKDAELLQVVERVCSGLGNENSSTVYQSQLSRLIDQGGSLARSNAIFVACANHNEALVQFILQKDRSLIDSRDDKENTPLMVAAAAAAGSATKDGIPREQPIIRRLLAAGANKGDVNSKGMTAYGIMTQTHKKNSRMMKAMTRQRSSAKRKTPGISQLKALLMPPEGPTEEDRNGGAGYGFVDFREDDRERGHCDSDDDEDEYTGNQRHYEYTNPSEEMQLGLAMMMNQAMNQAHYRAAARRGYYG